MIEATELIEWMRSRRSVRRFLDEEIDRGTLRRLIEAAAWAPSAGNRQDWFFTVVVSKSLISEMARIVRAKWEEILERNRDFGAIDEIRRYAEGFYAFEGAPAAIVVSAAKPAAVQTHLLGADAAAVSGSAASAAMATQNILLAAHALGLGTCCMTGPLAAREALAQRLALDRRREIVCLIALGRPAEAPPPPERKSIDSIARFIE